jgi:hypothetical protein
MELFPYIPSQFAHCWCIEKLMILQVDFVFCHLAIAVCGIWELLGKVFWVLKV